MSSPNGSIQIRRALFSVSDKNRVAELAQAMAQTGAEIVATGNTAQVIEAGGTPIIPIEQITGSPEAFQGRMKTLSFNVCSGILYRRGDESDHRDLEELKIKPIDCVVVNFYPFEQAVRDGKFGMELIEQIDIGGPTLVRSAAKNAPEVLVLTDPAQYDQVIKELKEHGGFSPQTAQRVAVDAWQLVARYDQAIVEAMSKEQSHDQANPLSLRYGENPHQSGRLHIRESSPIGWGAPLTDQALSYNNILDLSGAFMLAAGLREAQPNSTHVVIVKHNNPCGVCSVPKSIENPQEVALKRAWDGDPVSAFGGVLVFTDPLQTGTADWLKDNFVECIAAPEWTVESPSLQVMIEKRKKLKAVSVVHWTLSREDRESQVQVIGGNLVQDHDMDVPTIKSEPLDSKTKRHWPADKEQLAYFGIAVCRALKSNAIALVREIPEVKKAYQLVGAGQGQPNRVEALKALAIPRAQRVLDETGGSMDDVVMISDAFFPFRDSVDVAHEGGIKYIVQPGGSIKDKDSIAACDEHEMSMVFTGRRHFRH